MIPRMKIIPRRDGTLRIKRDMSWMKGERTRRDNPPPGNETGMV